MSIFDTLDDMDVELTTEWLERQGFSHPLEDVHFSMNKQTFISGFTGEEVRLTTGSLQHGLYIATMMVTDVGTNGYECDCNPEHKKYCISYSVRIFNSVFAEQLSVCQGDEYITTKADYDKACVHFAIELIDKLESLGVNVCVISTHSQHFEEIYEKIKTGLRNFIF